MSIYGGGYNCRPVWTAVVENSRDTEELGPSGSWFKNLRSRLSDKETAEVLSSIRDPSLLEFLSKNPLKSLAFSTETVRPGSRGQYKRHDLSIVVSPDRRPESFGEVFAPGRTWTVSTAAKTRIEAMQRTLFHEIGHHLEKVGGYEVESLIKSTRRRTREKAPTMYARERGWKEDWAEAFSGYHFEREALAAAAPLRYKLVEEVLKVLGIAK